MKNKTQPDPRQLRRILWGAQIAAVLILAALAWWLPDLTEIRPVPGASSMLFLIAVASVPVIFMVSSRLKSATGGSERVMRSPADADLERKGLLKYIVILALAELPAILGLVYVVLGGLPVQGLMLAAGSFVLLFLFPPG